MNKGFSILAAVLLTAGLCSCGPTAPEASTGVASASAHASRVDVHRSQPVCPAQLVCPV